ncbi:MAG: nitroreductase [Betaproteobacteria bacterium]|nr:nitroreductase [Betaproteobacteria bacterium]
MSGREAAALDALLSARYSCRAYRPERVSRELVERALRMAQQTPSWCNTQPWRVHVASGASRDALIRRLHDTASAETPIRPDFPFPEAYEGVFRDRRKVCGVQLYQSLGIGREDRQRAREQSLENFRAFGAPHMAIVTTEGALGPYGLLDCGLYLMSVMLAFRALGVDCIAQAALASYPDLVRAHFGLPETRRVVCGLSFGYAEPEAAINGYRTERAGIDEVIEWSE